MIFAASTTAVLQSADWTCSAASLAWMLESIGWPQTTDDVVNLLGPGRISSDIGLHDGSGAGLAAVLGELGIGAEHHQVAYDDILSMAGSVPMAIGSSSWYHWSGVRGSDGDTLLLANPAPGYRGVGQSMTRDQFSQLGSFYEVSITDASSAAPTDTGGSTPSLSLPVGTDWIPWVVGGAALAYGLGWI